MFIKKIKCSYIKTSLTQALTFYTVSIVLERIFNKNNRKIVSDAVLQIYESLSKTPYLLIFFRKISGFKCLPKNVSL